MKRHFVVVSRHEFVNASGKHVAVVARAVEATSVEDAASQYINDSGVVELRAIPVDDVPVVDLAAVRAWREAKWAKEREEEEQAQLAHALEVVAKHRANRRSGEPRPVAFTCLDCFRVPVVFSRETLDAVTREMAKPQPTMMPLIMAPHLAKACREAFPGVDVVETVRLGEGSEK